MRVNPISNFKGWVQIQLLELIKKLALSNFARSLIWGRNKAQSLVPLDTFTDSKGNAFQRLKGWRERIVPRYTRSLEPQPNNPRVKTKEIMNARNAVTAMENFFKIFGYSIRHIKILERGCLGGAHACAMAEFGARHVDGIDIPKYGIRQSPDRHLRIDLMFTFCVND